MQTHTLPPTNKSKKKIDGRCPIPRSEPQASSETHELIPTPQPPKPTLNKIPRSQPKASGEAHALIPPATPKTDPEQIPA
jgi:hypothetical protein